MTAADQPSEEAYPIEAVVFDFDGTIIDTEIGEYQTVAAEFARFGLDYPLEEFRELVGRADHPHWLDVLQTHTGPLPDSEQIRDRKVQAHHQMVADAPLRAGVTETIKRARYNGHKLAVATSSPLSWAHPLLEKRDLLQYFPVVATRDIVPHAKPWPDVYLAAADQLGVHPSRCLAIEDSANGVQAAKEAGMICVAVPNPITEASDLSAADLQLSSLADLPWHRFGLASPSS